MNPTSAAVDFSTGPRPSEPKDISGGPDLKIVVCSRDTSSGTYETWEEKVMKKERVTPRAQIMASNGAIVQAISSNKCPIGYIGTG